MKMLDLYLNKIWIWLGCFCFSVYSVVWAWWIMHNDDNRKISLKYSHYRDVTNMTLLQVMKAILKFGIITPCVILICNYINQQMQAKRLKIMHTYNIPTCFSARTSSLANPKYKDVQITKHNNFSITLIKY